MKTFCLFLLLTFSGFAAFAVKTVDAYYITNAGDSVQAPLMVTTNLFDSKLINDVTAFKKLRFIKDGEKFSVKQADIKKLVFVDFTNAKRVYVSNLIVPELESKGKLYEIKAMGKLNWAVSYMTHLYDGSIMSDDHFFLKGQKVVSIGFFGLKKKLKKLTEDRPDLIAQIEAIPTGGYLITRDKAILAVLEAYNTSK